MRTVSGTDLAAHADFPVNSRLSAVVLFHFPGPAPTAHADVLQASAEPGHLMPLEVAETDKYVRIHNGTANLCFLYQRTAFYRNTDIIRPLQPVSDNDVTARGQQIKPILIRGAQMLQRVFSPPHIERVAVREERTPAQFFHNIRHSFCVVGPEV